MFIQIFTDPSTVLLAQSSSGGGDAVGLLCVMVFMLAVVALSVALLAFQIWMLIDCVRYESKMPPDNNQFLVWILVLVFAGWVGALVYYFVRRPNNKYPGPIAKTPPKTGYH